MKQLLTLVFLLVTLVWASVMLIGSLIDGNVFTIIPLVGMAFIFFFSFKIVKFFAASYNEFDDLLNIMHNVLFMLQQKAQTNPGKTEKLVTLLTMEPEEFEAKFKDDANAF